jgi:hypothetical protein
MQTKMTQEEIKNIILKELPKLLKRDGAFRELVLSVTKGVYADKAQTEGRIDRILDELKRDREEQTRKSKEDQKRWDDQEKKWDENQKRWDDQEKKWEENQKRWDDQEKKWDQQEQKWLENQLVIREMLESIKALNRRFDGTIGALGARWGLSAEETFRSALRAILEESFGVTVKRYLEIDTEGVVFGHPDQVELDVIIFDGELILCEIKSSMSQFDMLGFWRKAQFYQDQNKRKATRIMVISPMVDARAMAVAKKLGLEVYSYADEVGKHRETVAPLQSHSDKP